PGRRPRPRVGRSGRGPRARCRPLLSVAGRTVFRMSSDARDGQPPVWAVVDTGIGPLLLAATGAGLVNVVFHATGPVRERALERLASRLGAAPVEDPGSPLLAEAIRQVEALPAGERPATAGPRGWGLSCGLPRAVQRERAAGVPAGAVDGKGARARRVGRPGGAQAVGMA